MSYPLRFLPEVPDDIAHACRWYEDRRAGLGQEFMGELRNVLARIADSPDLYAKGYRDVRSVRLKRFPYVLRYRFAKDVVTVLAVMHGSRHPFGWQSRAQ